MTRKTGTKKATRRQHPQEFREEALALAEKIGMPKAAREPGLHDSQLYGWRAKARAKRDQSELEQSLAAENARLKRQLAEQAEAGCQHDRKTIADSVRRQGLRAKAAKMFKATTNSRHNLPVAPNLLQQDFSATGPDQKYVGDITYLWTEQGWLYLAVVIDLYSRLVVGWAMSERMTKQLVCDALQMALWLCCMPTGIIVHSSTEASIVPVPTSG
jgi:transposase-like protein